MRFYKLFILGISAFLLNSCDKEKEILKGERESVLRAPEPIKEETIDVAVVLPTPHSLTQWPQPQEPLLKGLLPLRIKDVLQLSAQQSIETGLYPQLMAEPVSDGKFLYVLDGQGKVAAYSLEESQMLSVKWEFSIVPEKVNNVALGGGISYDNSSIYIGSPYGEIICLNSENGEVRWRRNIRNPVRMAPVLMKGNYGIILTITNEIEAFSLSNGKHLWNHQGMRDAAGLLKTNFPIISENVVIVAYSSGEMYALRLENGHPLWSYSLTSGRRFDSRSLLVPVNASFIIHKEHIFVSSQNSKMTCIHLWSGKKVWEKSIPEINDAILGGDYIYLICKQQDLMCLQSQTGKLIWAKTLRSSEESTRWARPILLNNQLFISNTASKGSYYSAVDGQWIKDIELPGPTLMSPLVFGDRMYFLSNDGMLSVWK